ncbi:MAG: glycosyltransferase [Velocimicrobium sp.]
MKKKVLFVINTLGHAGAEMAMLELMKQFDENQYELSLYVLMAQGELVHRVPSHVKLRNSTYNDKSVLSKEGYTNMLKTICIAARRNANGIRLMPYMIKNGCRMINGHHFQIEKLVWRLVSDGADHLEETYDLAIAYLEGGSAYYVADHVKAKQKAAFVHIDYAKAGYTRMLDRDCYLKFNRIFTVSDEVKEHFLKAYPECQLRTRVFHNFINQEEIIRKSKDGEGFVDHYNGIRLLTVGRLTNQKAYDIAIDAMVLLKKQNYNIRWYILGEGPERKRLEQKIGKVGLVKDFYLLGAVFNPYPYYVKTDIYVHATRFEGKSIAIQEAQTLGCAIIASNSSGNREQIRNEKDGILCELQAEKIAESIMRLVNDKKLRETFSKVSRHKKINYCEDMDMLLELLEM